MDEDAVVDVEGRVVVEALGAVTAHQRLHPVRPQGQPRCRRQLLLPPLHMLTASSRAKRVPLVVVRMPLTQLEPLAAARLSPSLLAAWLLTG